MKLSTGCMFVLIVGFALIIYFASGSLENTTIHAIDVAAEQANRPLSPTELIAQNQAVRDSAGEGGGRGATPFILITCLGGLVLLLAAAPFLGSLSGALKQGRLFARSKARPPRIVEGQGRPPYSDPEQPLLPAPVQPAQPQGGIQWFDED